MKRILFIFSTLFICVLCAAQPSWVKKASKSVFTLKTFDSNGSLLGNSTGFFIGEQGEAVSSFAPFRNAYRAVVIDAADKEYEVGCMLGANDIYDVAKFRVNIKKSQPLALASSSAVEGTSVWVLNYRDLKQVPQGQVQRAETFKESYAYYTVGLELSDHYIGAPLMNENGEVLGLMQPSAVGSKASFAVSALFVRDLRTTGLSINDPVLRSTAIRIALPDEVDQALLTLFVASSVKDSSAYATLINDFIAKFPTEQDGYIYRAQLASANKDYAASDRDMEEALHVAKRPDEVHMSWSRMIYQKLLYVPEPGYGPWTLDRALQEAREAYRLNAQPGYLQQQAYVLFSQGKYSETDAIYEQLFNSSLRSAELFYEASRCKEAQGDTLAQIALLDSAVAQFSRPYLKEVSGYLLARAQAYMNVGKNRPAVIDLNEYEDLMKTQVNDQFYYLRYQAEMGSRLFQQALNDIAHAIEMNPQEELYYSEKASLEVRVGLYDEAIATATQSIGLWPQNSDGYLFLGLAQCLKGLKADGIRNLEKAKDLGDPQAQNLIDKYSK